MKKKCQEGSVAKGKFEREGDRSTLLLIKPGSRGVLDHDGVQSPGKWYGSESWSRPSASPTHACIASRSPLRKEHTTDRRQTSQRTPSVMTFRAHMFKVPAKTTATPARLAIHEATVGAIYRENTNPKRNR